MPRWGRVDEGGGLTAVALILTIVGSAFGIVGLGLVVKTNEDLDEKDVISEKQADIQDFDAALGAFLCLLILVSLIFKNITMVVVAFGFAFHRWFSFLSDANEGRSLLQLFDDDDSFLKPGDLFEDDEDIIRKGFTGYFFLCLGIGLALLSLLFTPRRRNAFSLLLGLVIMAFGVVGVCLMWSWAHEFWSETNSTKFFNYTLAAEFAIATFTPFLVGPTLAFLSGLHNSPSLRAIGAFTSALAIVTLAHAVINPDVIPGGLEAEDIDEDSDSRKIRKSGSYILLFSNIGACIAFALRSQLDKSLD